MKKDYALKVDLRKFFNSEKEYKKFIQKYRGVRKRKRG